MSRFGEEQDPLFRRINSSISFDWRLASFDVEQSKAHARALVKLGVLDEAELRQIAEGLDRVGGELEQGSFEFSEDDEDIHMAIERRLTELIGPLGGKLHTARSRNDQVATDLSLLVRAHAARAIALPREPDGGAGRRRPRRTATGRPRPIPTCSAPSRCTWDTTCSPTSGCSSAMRGGSSAPLRRPPRCPPGSGALAGVNWEVDRERARRGPRLRASVPQLPRRGLQSGLRARLPLGRVDLRHALSRLGGEIVLWSSQEFGFCELPDSFASGSSIMPQKKNPDAAELLRGKAPRIAASLASLLGTMHALPLAYSKDLQEDKEPLFDAIDNLELCLGGGDRHDRRDQVQPRAAGRGGRG